MQKRGVFTSTSIMHYFNLLKNIYSHLADEGSKTVFRCRLNYSLSGNVNELSELINDFRCKVYSDPRYIKSKSIAGEYGNGAYIFGTGTYASMLHELDKAVKWRGFVANDPRSATFLGCPVIAVPELGRNYAGEYIFLPSKAYYAEMRKQLLEMGVSEERIIDMTALFDVTEGRQYFDLPHLQFGDKESFVDCGCYDGTSVLGFLERCNGRYEHIYCFEPDLQNVMKIESFFRNRDIDRYTLISKGVWDKEDELLFASNGTANSHIKGLIDKNENKIDKVSVTTLDECLGDKDISFIKMDIEGAEYKALCGARKIIEDQKPKLAICVYHKPEDVLEIPKLLLEMRDDYTFYLRHYSFRDTETVLYAV